MAFPFASHRPCRVTRRARGREDEAVLFTDAPASDDALLALVHEVSPRFLPGQVLHRSATSFVVAGTVDLAPVVAKVLSGGSPFWREHFLRELEAHRLFAAVPPPVRVA